MSAPPVQGQVSWLSHILIRVGYTGIGAWYRYIKYSHTPPHPDVSRFGCGSNIVMFTWHDT